MWQDFIFSIVSWIFVVALIPSIFGYNKPEWTTSLLTASVLTVYSATFYSMGMDSSGTSGAVIAACWWILFVQKIRE